VRRAALLAALAVLGSAPQVVAAQSADGAGRARDASWMAGVRIAC
jgi:Na+-driven multidrug efflux pump